MGAQDRKAVSKIAAEVERAMRVHIKSAITELVDRHFGPSRETKPLINDLVDLFLKDRARCQSAQHAQMSGIFDSLAVIQKELDFIKSGQRREVEKTKRIGRGVDDMAANWRNAQRSKKREIDPSVSEADWIENHK